MSTSRAPLAVMLEFAVAAAIGLLLYRMTRPYSRDRYWRSWLGQAARLFSWGSVACGAAGGVLAVFVALMTHTTITAVAALDGLLLGFSSWAVVKVSVEGYGVTPIAKVGMLTSLGAAWMEADLNERVEGTVARWAELALLDTIKETVGAQFIQAKLKKPTIDGDQLRCWLRDITTRLKSGNVQDFDEAEADLRALAARMVIDNRVPRP